MRSKERARDLGEVFTAEREVNAMLDLTRDINYASRFMEPGCGSGNFLVVILERKLALVRALPEVRAAKGIGRQAEYETKSLIALASIYGIDIDTVNITEATERLSAVMLREYAALRPKLAPSPEYAGAVAEILSTNIVLGDLLGDLKKIKLTEYTELAGHKIKRRLYRFDELIYPVAEVLGSQPVLLPHVPTPYGELPAVSYRSLAPHRTGAADRVDGETTS